MKKTQIVIIVFIAVALAIVVLWANDTGEANSFDAAFEQPGKEFMVKGELDRSQAIVYDPSVNSELTTFSMVDESGETRTVKLARAKPYDFERSETVVVHGKAVGDEFHAHKVLLKCPSKYEQESVIQTSQVNP